MPHVSEQVRPPATAPPHADAREWARIRSFLVVTDRCWIYTGALSDDGYGRFWAPGDAQGAPTVLRPSLWMWSAYNGPIPSGAVVRHDCDVTLCASPGCLRLGDQRDNLHDARTRDRLTHPGRVGKADRRGANAAARAVRDAVLTAVSAGVVEPVALGSVLRQARSIGDPYAEQELLF